MIIINNSRYLDIFFMPSVKRVRREMNRNVSVYLVVIGWFPLGIVGGIEVVLQMYFCWYHLGRSLASVTGHGSLDACCE